LIDAIAEIDKSLRSSRPGRRGPNGGGWIVAQPPQPNSGIQILGLPDSLEDLHSNRGSGIRHEPGEPNVMIL
jgi:hypothetical protein